MTSGRGRPMMSAALAAIALLGATMAVPSSASGSRGAAPTREYVTPPKERSRGRRKKRGEAKKDDPPKGKRLPHARQAKRAGWARTRAAARAQKWQHRKDGSAIDGRGDFRSAKSLLRGRWCARFGITSGRQWIRLRRALRRQVKELQGATQ